MTSHVLDTCALLDLAGGRWTSKLARRELSLAEDPVIPSVVVWEISRKMRVGKLELPCELADVLVFVDEICQRYHLRILPLTGDICHRAEMLPPLHDDPFDRMIMAVADESSCPVFTTDKRFENYPVKVINQR